MKTLKLKVTNEEYDAFQLDNKLQLNMHSFHEVVDEKFLSGFIGGGVLTTINKLKRIKLSIQNEDWNLLYNDFCLKFYKGKPTKSSLKEVYDELHNEKYITVIEHWNKYHPEDKFIINN